MRLVQSGGGGMIRMHAYIDIKFDGSKPPNELCVIPWGKNQSENGPYTFDDQAAKSVMAGYDRRGLECMFDWHHASLDPHPADPKEAIKSAGWYTLEVRRGLGLFATDIRWTPPALKAFENKEVRYFSPAFDADKTGRVVDYINCALTNLPATHNNQSLIAAARLGIGKQDVSDLRKERAFLRLESRMNYLKENHHGI
jgi:phage I-like protein